MKNKSEVKIQRLPLMSRLAFQYDEDDLLDVQWPRLSEIKWQKKKKNDWKILVFKGRQLRQITSQATELLKTLWYEDLFRV